jgi:5-methylthioadenosine/S-adenosylhomocysteine deaminase
MSLLIRNARILTLNDRLDIVEGSVSVRNGRIAGIGPVGGPHDRVIDAGGGLVLPGLIQTHVHLCQTLFRGRADDLVLMDWLRTRVWPMEAAHSPRSLAAAARLAAAELLRTGTTAVLTMETVHDTEAVCEAIAGTGLRATIGKCMMDAPGDGVPARLVQDTQRSIDESLALHRAWHGAANGRLRVALAPRFAVSCSRELLEAVAALAPDLDVVVHTHASESREEIELVRARTGLDNIEYLAAVGLASPRLCAAHCVWVDDRAQAVLAERSVRVLHCPGSNLKLGSGISPVAAMRARGISVSLASDGAACNNRLDMFDEMRLAAVLQGVRDRPGALTARDALWMATREGARALGLEHEIGSLEVGKRADMLILATHGAHLAPAADVYSTVVYAARGTDVTTVIVDGDVLVEDGRLTRLDVEAIVDEADTAAAALWERAHR